MTMFLATLLGWYFVILSLFVLFKRESFNAVVADISKHRASMFVLTIINLIGGLLLVISHNDWGPGWPVVVTILCWLVLLGGLIRLFFLDEILKKGKGFSMNHTKSTVVGVIVLLIGLFLLYHVYISHGEMSQFF